MRREIERRLSEIEGQSKSSVRPYVWVWPWQSKAEALAERNVAGRANGAPSLGDRDVTYIMTAGRTVPA